MALSCEKVSLYVNAASVALAGVQGMIAPLSNKLSPSFMMWQVIVIGGLTVAINVYKMVMDAKHGHKH